MRATVPDFIGLCTDPAKACEVTQNAKIACLLLPGIGLADDLREVNEMGVQVARIAVC